MGEWISTKERLPADGVEVLVYATWRVMSVGKRGRPPDPDGNPIRDYTWITDGGWAYSSDITHWQPLPAPPER
jgi:hypothetical protein